MSRRLVIIMWALFLVVVGVGPAEHEAMAGCIPLAGGGQYCASWITGSAVCNGKASGVSKLCDPKTGICSGQILCAEGGTVGNSTNCNSTNNIFPTATDNCGVQGVAICTNPKGNSSQANGQPYTLNAVLEGVALTLNCTKNGVCKGSVSLDASSTQVACINPNWNFITFTPTIFKAKSCFCPTTYNQSTDPPTCVGGTETCDIELCTLNSNNVSAGLVYQCSTLPNP